MRYGRVVGVVAMLAGAGMVWADGNQVDHLVQGNNAFAFELYGKVRGEAGNLFLSPYSISTALAMTYAGAKGNTEAEMAKVLHFGLGQEGLHAAFKDLIADLNGRQKAGQAYELSVANALWAQKDYAFRKEYFDLVRQQYGAGLENVDFKGATEEARKTINAWVEKETKEKIKELLKPDTVGRDTVLVLTNAIYFKGKWAVEFDKKLTKDEPWRTKVLYDRLPRLVPFMHQKGEFRHVEMDGVQVLELPYKGNEVTMVVVLPKKVYGLGEVEKELAAAKLEEWTAKMRQQEVEVALPRFKATSEFELGEVLKSMGMADAFEGGKADFSGMTGNRELSISKVIHKAYVDVNEEGTEAAGATAVIMEKGPPEKPKEFRADHPFFFMIRDRKTGSVLFMGRVAEPGTE